MEINSDYTLGVKDYSYLSDNEKKLIKFLEPSFFPSIYQKAECSYTPDTKGYSYYGGSGISFTSGKTKLDGYFAGKAAKGGDYGYLAEFSVNQTWADFLQPVENLSLASQIRVRNNHCGSNNMQYRITPIKASYDINNSYIPVDNIYYYPVYVTIQDDLKGNNDVVKFGSLLGVSKGNYYTEIQADTNNERSSKINMCLNFGIKF